MLYRAGRCSVCILVVLGRPMLDHLLARLRVLAVRQTREMFWTNGTSQAHPGRELALPLTRNCSVLFVVALGAGSELHLVVGLCLA